MLLYHLFTVYILFFLPPSRYSLIGKYIQEWREGRMRAQLVSHTDAH
jgi:hypothetical protein